MSKVNTKEARKIKSIEKIITPTQTTWVGDGFNTNSFFPSHLESDQRMSPFYILGHNAKMNFPPREKLYGVGAHPHRGFETVTLAYHGKIAHHDSRGNHGVIGEGEVQWMTAGRGILHSEYHEEEFNRNGGLFQMVQIWVNLPAKDKLTEPKYQEINSKNMGVYELPDNGGKVDVVAGEFKGVKGGATTFSPMHLYNVYLKKGVKFEMDFPEHYNTSILVIDGSATFNQNETVNENSLALFRNDGENIEVTAQSDSILLVMSGEPLNEPIVGYGPFVMNTQEQIIEAFEDFRRGEFGNLN